MIWAKVIFGQAVILIGNHGQPYIYVLEYKEKYQLTGGSFCPEEKFIHEEVARQARLHKW